MSKGSWTRPMDVSKRAYANNHDRIYDPARFQMNQIIENAMLTARPMWRCKEV